MYSYHKGYQKVLGMDIHGIPSVTDGAINTQGTDAVIELRKTLPKSPVSDPDEVARVVFMLTTDISAFMYGSTIVVDGGDCMGVK